MSTNSKMNWTFKPFRLAAVFLALPLLLWTAGCDSNGGDDPPPPPPTSQAVSVYDTSGATITVSEFDDFDNQGATENGQRTNENGDPLGIGYIEDDGTAVNEVTWTSDNTYILNGRIFVNDGQTLTIEAGTVIKGDVDRTDPTEVSALIVARGGTIIAEGTPDAPIVFTAETDDVADPNDLGPEQRGLWGGVIILGSAGLNSEPGETVVEGIPTDDPFAANRGLYGGSNDSDDSGIFRYVSIRYGGNAIAADNEINGLTMGGVGSGTEIDHVEVYNNLDDGFEWFGGTVNTKYLIAAFVGDDSFDIDEGYRGEGQFWFAVQPSDASTGNGAEHDGGTSPEAGQPFATPVISNATFIGAGLGGDADIALYFRDNFAGSYLNSIFTEFPSTAIEIEDLREEDADSRTRREEGTIEVANNIFWEFGSFDGTPSFGEIIRITEFDSDGDDDPDTPVDEAFRGTLASYLEAAGNVITSPMLISTDRSSLNPRPSSGSPALSGADFSAKSGLSSINTSVSYLGAFSGTAEDDQNFVSWSFIGNGGASGNGLGILQ